MTLVPAPGGRRQTISVLGSSALVNAPRARASLGMTKPPRASLGRRLSISSSTRRTSMYGQRPITTVSDPRPIGSKSFQQDNIRALIKFLTLRSYDREISPKILFTPSRNDFVHIVTFLFRHIDPNFAFDQTNQNWSDDFPVFFEALGYPFKISKRSLLSVGSPHTWPALLAALVWLIDLLTFIEQSENNAARAITDNGMQLMDSNGDKVFYQYLSTAYIKFLDGADNFSFMETNLADQFKEKNDVVKEDISRMRREIEGMRSEIVALQGARSSLPDAQERKRALTADVKKFEKLVAELEEYKKGVVKSRVEIEKQLDAQHQSLVSAEMEAATLRQQLDRQEMSAVDVARIFAEKSLLQKTLGKLTAEMDSIKTSNWEKEMAVGVSIAKLEAAAQAYNAMATMQNLMPVATAKFAHGIDYELKLELTGESAESMLSIDMKRVIKPALARLKDSFSKTLRKQAVEKRRAHESLALSAELRTEKADEVSALQSRLMKLETAHREQRELKGAELKACVSRVEDIELETSCATNKMAAALAASESELGAVRTQLARVMTTTAEEQNALRDLVTQSMEELASHKVYIAQQITTFDDMMQSYA